MAHQYRALRSPNPSGWRKEDQIRAHFFQLAQTAPVGAHKRSTIWKVLQQAMRVLKVNATQQKLLETLVWSTFEDDWTTGNRPIVWLSNAALARKAGLAIATSTVRSALASLADLGLITFRDSGNCRRAGRRDDGQIVYAYGIDLSVLEARYDELHAMVSAHKADEEAIMAARTAVQKLRRSIPAHLQAAQLQQFPGRWNTYQRRYERIVDYLGRSSRAKRTMLERTQRALSRLLDHVQKALVLCALPENAVAKATNDGCLLETTNQSHFVECTSERNCADAQSVSSSTDTGCAGEKKALEESEGGGANVQPGSSTPQGYQIHLDSVLRACPEFLVWWSGDPIRSWADLAKAAGQIRGLHGISPSAWDDACSTLGIQGAAVALAIIVQKSAGGVIREPGGYLRGMTERQRAGALRLDRSIRALLAEGEVRSAETSSPQHARRAATPYMPSTNWTPRMM